MPAIIYLSSVFTRATPDATPQLKTTFHYDKNPLRPDPELPYYEHEISQLSPGNRQIRHFAMGISRKPADFSIENRVEPEMLFEYCLAGRYRVHDRLLGPGDFILHNSNESYSSAPAGEDCTILWCAWEGELFDTVTEKLTRFDRCAVHHLGKPEAMRALFHTMLYAFDYAEADNAGSISGFMHLLMALIPEQREETPLPPLVRRAVDMIGFEYPTLTVESLAAALDVTPAHLSRSFRAAVGIPPKQYITAARLDRAIFLLSHTDLPLRDIADRIGYDNYNNFYVTFRREYGVSPEVYRKEHK